MNEETKMIETLEDVACECGGRARVHAVAFKDGVKFYCDCENACGAVTEFHPSAEEAVNAFKAKEWAGFPDGYVPWNKAEEEVA